MSSQWYYSRDGQRLGPVSEEQITRLIADRQVSLDTLVWREGMSDWMPLEAIERFRDHLRSAPPPLPPPRGDELTKTPGGDSRTTAGPAVSWLNRLLWTSVGLAAVLVAGIWIGLFYRRQQEGSSRTTAYQQQREHSAGEASTPDSVVPPEDESQSKEQGSDEAPIADPPSVVVPPAPTGPKPAESKTAELDPAAKSTESFVVAPPANLVPDLPPEASRAAKSAATETTSKGAAVRSPADEPATFYQQINIRRRSSSLVQGISMPMNLSYKVLSRFDAERRKPDGTRIVVQIIEDTKLGDADDLAKATLQGSLNAIKRQQYTYKLNRHNEVIEFTGHVKNKTVLPFPKMSSRGFMMTSAIDKDGWKELAQITFFQPAKDTRRGQTWMRQMTHDWDPLGSWTGVTSFASKELRGTQEEFQFAHDLKYEKPIKSSLGVLEVVSAAFKPDVAGGTILYDSQKGRIVSAEEQFQVTGEVQAKVLGRTTTIKIQEQQSMKVVVTDERPDDW